MSLLGNLLLKSVTSIPQAVSLWRRFPVGSVELRTRYGAWERPPYAYGTYHAAQQAKLLGVPGISVIEFGVAGGNGLLALEKIADEIAAHFGIRISVFGFDSAVGMPEAADYRDLPYVWSRGFYDMDVAQLKARLHPETRLILGDVKGTVQNLQDVKDPIGFVSFDLDYYSSTRAALTIFDLPSASRLPRVYCYFDDIIYPEFACHNAWTGELCAIREFNEQHSDMKLSPFHQLRWMRPHAESWNEQIYILHDFHHPLYSVNLMLKFGHQPQKRLRRTPNRQSANSPS
jgi:hypothetical protein